MSYTNRQLAAIMFTDIVGYTALMGSDESKALSVLRSNRSIHKRLIKEYGGKWLKEMGDGTLARFKTISDAVYCAGELIRSCSDEDIELRIGIHFGEVTEEEGDIFGEGVNVASRLEPLAKPNQILVSESIHRNIKNKQGIQSTFIDEKQLKNVDEPLRVYKVEVETTPTLKTLKTRNNRKPIFIALGLALAILIIYSLANYFAIEKSARTSTLEKSIAVLPFKNLSTNEEDQYLADGAMDAILSHLQRIDDLSVRSRTSTESYRESPKNIIEIGKELEVNYILEGSFQKVGNQANLIVQLISTNNDEHLWAEEYNRDWSEIFAVQKEVAILIANELYASLTETARKGIEVIPTTNMDAYDLFLKGNQAFNRSWRKMDINSINESIKHYEKAVELDPNFSLAFTGLGRSYWWLAMLASNDKRPDLYKKSKMYLKNAIDLDPYNGWAYAEMSVVSISWDWDSIATRKNHDLAIKLMPNDRNAYIHKFYFERRLGNCDKMIALQKELKRFNSNVDNPFSDWNLMILSCQKKYAEIARLANEYWHENIGANKAWEIFFSYLILHEYEKAAKVVSHFKEDLEDRSYYYLTNGVLKAKENDVVLALAMCDSLKNKSYENVSTALIHAALGNKNKMYEYLDKGILVGESFHTLILRFPEIVDCESDEEFKRIQKEIWTPRE